MLSYAFVFRRLRFTYGALPYATTPQASEGCLSSSLRACRTKSCVGGVASKSLEICSEINSANIAMRGSACLLGVVVCHGEHTYSPTLS